MPSIGEWTNLRDYVGSEADAGGKLKETGTTHWIAPNLGATNESGFTALPGGYGNANLFTSSNNFSEDLGERAWFWSTSQTGGPEAKSVMLRFDERSFNINNNSSKNYRFSIRCIKD